MLIYPKEKVDLKKIKHKKNISLDQERYLPLKIAPKSHLTSQEDFNDDNKLTNINNLDLKIYIPTHITENIKIDNNELKKVSKRYHNSSIKYDTENKKPSLTSIYIRNYNIKTQANHNNQIPSTTRGDKNNINLSMSHEQGDTDKIIRRRRKREKSSREIQQKISKIKPDSINIEQDSLDKIEFRDQKSVESIISLVQKSVESSEKLGIHSTYESQYLNSLGQSDENSIGSVIFIGKKKRKHKKKRSSQSPFKKLEGNKLLIRTDLIVPKMPPINKYWTKNSPKIKSENEERYRYSIIKKEFNNDSLGSSLSRDRNKNSAIKTSSEFINVQSVYSELAQESNNPNPSQQKEKIDLKTTKKANSFVIPPKRPSLPANHILNTVQSNKPVSINNSAISPNNRSLFLFKRNYRNSLHNSNISITQIKDNSFSEGINEIKIGDVANKIKLSPIKLFNRPKNKFENYTSVIKELSPIFKKETTPIKVKSDEFGAYNNNISILPLPYTDKDNPFYDENVSLLEVSPESAAPVNKIKTIREKVAERKKREFKELMQSLDLHEEIVEFVKLAKANVSNPKHSIADKRAEKMINGIDSSVFLLPELSLEIESIKSEVSFIELNERDEISN